MAEVLEAMDRNFEGREEMRQLLSTKTDCYGNDMDDVDELAKKVVEIYGLETDKYRSLYGGRFHPGFSSVSSNVPTARQCARSRMEERNTRPLRMEILPVIARISPVRRRLPFPAAN